MIDFVILICNAIPCLTVHMNSVEEGKDVPLFEPDFGGPQAHQKLREIREDYENTLGKLVLISSFSYFESYIGEVIGEVYEFHGGEEWEEAIRERNVDSINMDYGEFVASRNKLSDYWKNGREQSYRKHQEILSAAGYRFPSDLLASYGVGALRKKIKGIRAWMIPELLRDAFIFDMADADVGVFDEIRNLRNDAAHGKVHGIDLSRAMEMNAFLRGLSKRVDQHIVRHFMVIESR